MAVLSGRDGTIGMTPSGGSESSLLHFTNGNLDYGAEVQTYMARDGGGAQKTVKGAESGSGSIELVFSDTPLFEATFSTGDLVTLTFYHDSGMSVSATGSARLGQFSRELNRDGSIQTLSVDFETDGSWTFPS